MDNPTETDISSSKSKRFRNTSETDEGIQPPAVKPTGQLNIHIDDDNYDMEDKLQHGLAIIFNHNYLDVIRDEDKKERKGTEYDVTVLKETFQKINCETKVHHDLTESEIKEELMRVQKMDHSKHNCLIITVLTHGYGMKLCANDDTYESKDLWKPFVGNQCPGLVGKPKIIFIQACRGEKCDPGILVKSRPSISDGLLQDHEVDSAPVTLFYEDHVIPIMADFLIMYSSFEDYKSFRCPNNGSWFIQSLCEQLKSKAFTNDLVTILTIVNRKIATLYISSSKTEIENDKKKQVCVVLSTLMRLIQFKEHETSLPENVPENSL